MKIRLFTDGAARGNPGPSGVGGVIYSDQGKELAAFRKYIGTATNNVAEYEALIFGLDHAKKYKPCMLEIFMDSELVVNQMIGLFKVKDEKLITLFKTAQSKLSDFDTVNITYIPRIKNTVADKLANQAINLKSISI
jgi:ribonuclease HI